MPPEKSTKPDKNLKPQQILSLQILPILPISIKLHAIKLKFLLSYRLVKKSFFIIFPHVPYTESLQYKTTNAIQLGPSFVAADAA